MAGVAMVVETATRVVAMMVEKRILNVLEMTVDFGIED